MRKNKYGARKVIMGGFAFDSKREAQRWRELTLMERAGEIVGLERQVSFTLIPAQRDAGGKLLERCVQYVADFVYTDMHSGETVVEDAKGVRTKEYIIKRKLMLKEHGIRIREV